MDDGIVNVVVNPPAVSVLIVLLKTSPETPVWVSLNSSVPATPVTLAGKPVPTTVIVPVRPLVGLMVIERPEMVTSTVAVAVPSETLTRRTPVAVPVGMRICNLKSSRVPSRSRSVRASGKVVTALVVTRATPPNVIPESATKLATV
jgi:hypothetical protein